MKEREIPQVSQKIPRGNEGIMRVDDEPDILEFGQRLLEGLGYHISIFSDGDAAQLFLKQNPDSCDLLITDFMMPKIWGGDLCEKMRKIKPELKVIIWTGYGAVVQKLRESGVHGALQKSIMAEEPACKVREALDKGECSFWRKRYSPPGFIPEVLGFQGWIVQSPGGFFS